LGKSVQSKNEDLLASKQDLQSLRDELAALKIKVDGALERERLLSGDLQNVLSNAESAMLFLDNHLHLRFYTRIAESLFEIKPSDVGRPLTKISLLSVDGTLLNDAKKMLRTLTPVEREIEFQNGASYIRRVAPSDIQGQHSKGVVVTYAHSAGRRRASGISGSTKQQIQLASAAKSRLLASASHDLRQPLQSLVLLHSLLTKSVEDRKARGLLQRFEETLNSMSAILNMLFDVNQIEARNVQPDVITFPINDLLHRLQCEFNVQAKARDLSLRILPCGLSIRSDPALLEQMIRNLLSNALKYTPRGKVLLGCRRRGKMLSVEVWDAGIGVPTPELDAIFDEFHQIDAAERERGQGVGLGLSIVERLGRLLGHHVGLRSQLGKGSVFTIEVPLASNEVRPLAKAKESHLVRRHRAQHSPEAARHSDSSIIFVVDDDRGVCEALRSVLEDDGRTVEDYQSCEEFLRAYRPGREACLLIDAYLPGMNGLELLRHLRELGEHPPAIMITGKADVSTAVQAMKAGALDFIEKPIGRAELLSCVEHALEQARDSTALSARREAAASQISELTPRQRQIMDLVLAGHPSKNIAADLGISQRTVENHRASIMRKTGSRSLPELARLVLTATLQGVDAASAR
jgi:two-component system CheB/CheR fusion protein